MYLLGIHIIKTNSSVTKVLSDTWYPFGNYNKPAKGKCVKVDILSEKKRSDHIYHLPGLPELSINCIVGMNGAGKSTLLDIIYRMINNFTYRMLGASKAKSVGRELHYAYGVYADLYFVCEDIQYRISCRDEQTTLFQEKTDTKTFERVEIKDANNPKPILKKFFYTIATNYSIYAFNEKEYLPDDTVDSSASKVNGEWISGLFHKNDGYYTPLVITPFRSEGNIDVDKENKLAKQRVMALALLSEAHHGNFFEKYSPVSVTYSLDTSYKERTEATYQREIQATYKGLDIRHIIRAFELAWEKYFESENPDYNIEYNDERYHLAIFYMAYKTVKICFTYEDYRKAFNVKALLKANTNLDTFTEYVNKKMPIKSKEVICKIIDEMQDKTGDKNHITLKLSVCKAFIESLSKGSCYWEVCGNKNVVDILNRTKLKTFNDAVIALPPAFYRSNMIFRPTPSFSNVELTPDSVLQAKTLPKLPNIMLMMGNSWDTINKGQEFSLEKMSSGERQMLYSLSYVLYHIKNIQSVRDDDYRVSYHNIFLIFDEAELYFHPDYQRRFIGMLLDALSWCNIDRHKIHSIGILIVTHSPFVLTDILTQNTLYLYDGCPRKVEQQTFGANYYDILNKSFFFEKRAIGDISAKTFTSLIQQKNKNGQIDNEELSIVGDELVKAYLRTR